MWHENFLNHDHEKASFRELESIYASTRDFIISLGELEGIAYGLERFIGASSPKSQREKAELLSFDENKGVLHIDNAEIKVKKLGNEYHLLKIIFEDENEIKKEWFFSEIAEIYDQADAENAKRFSNACYQLKNKLLMAGIKDFFITTSQSVKINPKYLKS